MVRVRGGTLCEGHRADTSDEQSWPALTGVGRGGGGYLNPRSPLRAPPRLLANQSVSSACPLAAPLQKLCWHGEGTLGPRGYKGQGRGQGRGSFPASRPPGRFSEITGIRTVRTSRCLGPWGWAQTWPSAACGPGVPGPSDHVRPAHFPQPSAGVCCLVYHKGLRSAEGASHLPMQTLADRFCEAPVEGPTVSS